MKIFSWMQSKLHARKETGKLNPIISNDQILGETCIEELSDWPHGLLAIGTFGNKSVKEIPESCNLEGTGPSMDHLKYITPEEIGIQKEGNVILNRQDSESNSAAEIETHNISRNKIFKSSSSSDIDKTSNYTLSDDIRSKNNLLQRSSSIVLTRGKENCSDSTKNSIGKKSLSFLVKKMFITETNLRSSLRDPLPEARLKRTRMEKVFRVMLNKKIFPQTIIPRATTTKKYVNNEQPCATGGNDELSDEVAAGSKWVKTDSDFIVLEI